MKPDKKPFSLLSPEGSKRILWILIVIILLSSFCARLITTQGGSVKCEKVAIDARGATLSAELYYPAGTGEGANLPAVIVAHGGGCTLETVKGIAQELARRGFVVLNVSGYGSGLSEQPLFDEGGFGPGNNSLDTPAGYMDALNFVRTLKFVDQTRIGVTGHSTGSKRVSATASADCGYLSLNDIMINILYDTFGQTFTEEEIKEDADKLAEDRLNDDQLQYYWNLKAQNEEHYNTRVKAVALFGSDAFLILPAKTVTVGGYEVTRNCQTNLTVINGKFDERYLLTKDPNKEAFYTGGSDIELEQWYELNDLDQSSRTLGDFRSTSIVSNAELRKAIEDRSSRVIVYTSGTHSWEFFSQQMAGGISKYFEQTLNYNRGNLTDPSTTPLDTTKQVWPFRVMFNCIAMVAMLLMVLPILTLLLNRKKFAECVVDVPDDARQKYNPYLYWGANLLAVVTGVVAIFKANKGGIFAYDPGKFLCLTRTACLTIEFLKWMCIGSAIILVAAVIINKKTCGVTGLRALNLNINIRKILKLLLIALIIVGCCYAALMVCEYFFAEQFRLWMTAFGEMKADYWFIALRYVLLFFPIFLLLGAAINLNKRTDIPEWKDTLLAVVFNSLGIWGVCIIMIVVAYIKGKNCAAGEMISNFICSYQLLVSVPLTVFFAKYFYNRTGSIWAGAAFNACLICWAMTATLGIHDLYVGQTWFSVVLGL